MARLVIGEVSDQLYMDVGPTPGRLARWLDLGQGLWFAENEAGGLIGIFVEGLANRGGLVVRIFAEETMDCLYLDLSGDRLAVRGTEAAPGIWIYVDQAGQLAAIELLDLASVGGLTADPMDGEQPRPRAAWYDEIEAAARHQLAARST